MREVRAGGACESREGDACAMRMQWCSGGAMGEACAPAIQSHADCESLVLLVTGRLSIGTAARGLLQHGWGTCTGMIERIESAHAMRARCVRRGGTGE